MALWVLGCLRVAKGALGGFKERAAVALIRLEMAAFGPFVPGIDEHDALPALLPGARDVDDARKPALVIRRLGIDEAVRGVLAASRIVPAGHHAAKELVVRARLGKSEPGGRDVIEDRAAKPGPHARHARRHVVDAEKMRRKLHRGIEAQLARILLGLVDALHHAEIKLADAP